MRQMWVWEHTFWQGCEVWATKPVSDSAKWSSEGAHNHQKRLRKGHWGRTDDGKDPAMQMWWKAVQAWRRSWQRSWSQNELGVLRHPKAERRLTNGSMGTRAGGTVSI